MKPYPKYKDSGVDWMGDIPNQWESCMIKRLSKVRRGASPRPIDDPKYFDENGEFAWVRIADVSASERYLMKTTQTLSELGASLSVKRYPDDLFLSIAGSVGKPIITKIKCCIHDGFVWFPDLKMNPEYLYYIFSTGLPYQGLGKWGTQLNLNTDTVGEIYVPLPLPEETNLNVKYLDHKIAQVDTLIEKKNRLIELLKEERKAVINQGVTKGLDPNVPLKDSGIEWLGEIPAHWEVKKLKYLTTKIGSGITPKGGSAIYLDTGIPLLRSQNIHFNGLLLDDVAYISEEIFAGMLNTEVLAGDVLLNITGASIGRCYYVGESLGKANVNQHVCIVRPNGDIETKYLYLILASNVGQTQVFNCQTGANREGLNFEQLGNFTVPHPNKKERDSIVNYIEKETTRIDSIISKSEREIELSQEYRTAFISEVVTGKIDVREEKI